MNGSRRSKGPWGHRLLMSFCAVLMGLLCYWLLGFVVRDIGSWRGTSYDKFEEGRLNAQLVEQLDETEEQLRDTRRRIEDEQQRQSLLRDSTANSQQTMNQLLEIQRLILKKGVTPSAEEQKALAESQQRFLANQKHYQEINTRIVELNEELRNVRDRQNEIADELEEQRQPIRKEYKDFLAGHEFKVAVFKLSVLVPLLLVAVLLFVRLRGGIYAPMVYAFGLPALIKVGDVMHEYFPTKLFKYVLILAVLAVVVRVLVYLLRMVAFPKRDWLLKQYQEAYEVFLCPICAYPIRRGPFKYALWTRRSIKKLARPLTTSVVDSDEAYTCPVCSTRLYEECEKCHGIRHGLLPACEKCGHTKPEEASAV